MLPVGCRVGVGASDGQRQREEEKGRREHWGHQGIGRPRWEMKAGSV